MPPDAPSTQEHEPTLAEVAALARKASEDANKALEQGKGKEETETAVTESVEQTAKDKNLSISQEDAGMIAESVIVALDAKGVFPPEEEPAETPPPTAEPATETGASSAAPSDGPAAPTNDEPPKQGKRKWSERFVGRT